MEPRIILLLGSFDRETKEVLNAVKNEVIKRFSGLDLYCFLLDDLDLYTSDDGEYGLLIEKYAEDRITVFISDKERLIHTEDVQLKSDNVTAEALEFLKEWCVKKDRTPPERLIPHTIFMKLERLFRDSEIVALIRHKEETRGGEYVELAYGIRDYHDKLYFIAKDDIKLSTMVDEILSKFKVRKINYRDNTDLINKVLDTIQ